MGEVKKTFGVWVGSLPDKITETDLKKEFQQYGPIANIALVKDKNGRLKGFGFVNFYSKEVAEVAANDMNDTAVLGSIIQTNFKDENHTKFDVRTLTDCLTFETKGRCVKKGCIFRHKKEAIQQTTICRNWLDKKCADIECPKRHTSKLQNKADTDPSKETKFPRCNSHDKVKCFGQCKDPNCAREHYVNEEALINHIWKQSDESPPKNEPFCRECGKVFLSPFEEQNHRHEDVYEIVKNSTRNVFEKHPVRKEEFLPVSRPDSPDSLEKIGVYWDIENCPVKNKSTAAVVKRIRDVYMPGRSEVEFVCVCDTLRQKKHVLNELNKAEVQVVHVDGAAKNAADDKLKQLMIKFSKIVKYPATVLLISGDVNFSPILSELKHTSKFRIILLHNANASKDLLSFAHEARRFDHFTADLPLNHTRQVQVANDADIVRTTEVLVTNLPRAENPVMITSRLSRLSDNCGGKVGKLMPTADGKMQCVISFSDATRADRAMERLDGQDVCGSKIKVNPFWGDINLAKKAPPVRVPGPVRTNLSKSLSMGALLDPKHFLQGGQADAVAGHNLPLSGSYRPLFNSPMHNYPPSRSHMQQKMPIFDSPRQNFPPYGNYKQQNTPRPNLPPSGNYKQQNTPRPNLPPTGSLNHQNLPPPKKGTPNILRDKVLAVLQGTSYWLPISAFVHKFREIHKSPFIFPNHLDSLKAVVFVDGKAGRKFVSLLKPEKFNIKFKIDQETFNRKLQWVLQEHKRAIRLSGLPALFWSYKNKLKQDENGTPLISLVSNCPNVELVEKSMTVRAMPSPAHRPVFLEDLELLLQNSPKLEIPLNRWNAWYNNFFGTAFVPSTYGASTIEELLRMIPHAIKVSRVNDTDTITFTADFLKEIITSNLEKMLNAYNATRIEINGLANDYFKFFGWTLPFKGKKAKLVTYLRGFKERVWIDADEAGKLFLGLKKEKESPFAVFRKELLSLLRSKASRKLLLSELVEEFAEFHRKPPQMNNLGFDHPADLFKALEKDVKMFLEDDVRFIGLVESPSSVKKSAAAWKKCLLDLERSPDGILLLQDIKSNQREDLLDSVPPKVKLLGSGQSRCFVLSSKLESLKKERPLDVINKMLYKSENYTLSVKEVFDNLDGKEEQKEVSRLMNLLRLTRRPLGIRQERELVEGHMLPLDQNKMLEFLCEEIQELLKGEPTKTISLHKFPGEYHKKFGRQLKLKPFGFSKLMELLDALPPNMIQVTSINDAPHITLHGVSRFADEVTQLLQKRNGAILHNQLSDIHAKEHERFKPADHGVKSMGAALAIFPKKFLVFETSIPIVISREFLLSCGNVAGLPDTASKSHESKGAAASSSNGYDDDDDDDDDDEDNSDDTDDDNSVEIEECGSITGSISGGEDLLDLSDADYDLSQPENPEWWMIDDAPELPPPELEPEKVFEEKGSSPAPEAVVYDLIPPLEDIDDGGSVAKPGVSKSTASKPGVRHPSLQGRAASLNSIISTPKLTDNFREQKPFDGDPPLEERKSLSSRKGKKGRKKVAANFNMTE